MQGTISLQSSNGSIQYAAWTTGPVAAEWTEYAATLTASWDDDAAVLAISLPQDCMLDIDMVSLFPAANGRLGQISPFRQDLLQLLQELAPK